MRAVALGGGHGTAVTLKALRRLTSDVTGIVSVADNGGSSGRLRKMLDVAAVGDVRKCLLALSCSTNELAAVFDHRFTRGDLAGHPIGNLLLVGLIDASGDLQASIDQAGAMLEITGRVLPASRKGVTLVADGGGGRTEGQVQVAASTSVRTLSTWPSDVVAPNDAVRAIGDADLVVIGPGSLFTSVLAACVVPGVREALATTTATRVYVANLFAQEPETSGFTLADHLEALRANGVVVDVTLANTSWPTTHSDDDHVVFADLAGANGRVHDPVKLARGLAQLVA